MAFGDLGSADVTAMQDWTTPRSSSAEQKTEDLYTIAQEDGDVVTWVPEWQKWNGYYRTIPEIKSPLDTNVLWAIGLGWESPKKDLLHKIKGNGKEIIDSILANIMTQYLICGDGFAEIIKDKKGRLLNIKPLNPGEMRIVANKRGMIKKYEQISTKENQTKVLHSWKPERIFHLSWNRVANEIHGIPMIEKLNSQIIKINQAKDITAVIHRRHALPIKIWEVDTDDPAEMAAFKAKQDNAYKNVENLVVPLGAAKATVLEMQKGAIKEGVEWIDSLNKELTRGLGVPNVTQGSGEGSSEATSKILHLNYQPRAGNHREFMEKQMKSQLNIEITFKEPPSIDPSLLTDARKNTGDDPTDNKIKEVK